MSTYKLKNLKIEARQLDDNMPEAYLEIFTGEISENKPRRSYKKLVHFYNPASVLPLSDNKLHIGYIGHRQAKTFQEFETGDYLVREIVEGGYVLIYVVRKELFEYLFEEIK